MIPEFCLTVERNHVDSGELLEELNDKTQCQPACVLHFRFLEQQT